MNVGEGVYTFPIRHVGCRYINKWNNLFGQNCARFYQSFYERLAQTRKKF